MARSTGATGIRRIRLSLVLPLVAPMFLTLLIPYAAQAVHDTGIFQLDGDAQTSTNTAGTPAALDDWDKVCNQVTGGGPAGRGAAAGPHRAPPWSLAPRPEPDHRHLPRRRAQDPLRH